MTAVGQLRYTLLLIGLLSWNSVRGQVNVSGVLTNQQGQRITDCQLIIKDAQQGRILAMLFPNEEGYFEHTTAQDSITGLTVRCQGLGYQTFDTLLMVGAATHHTLAISLQRATFDLPTASITAQRRRIIINQDTVFYQVGEYADEDTKKLIDILEKLPGVSVDRKTGLIKYKGRQVEALLVDGADIFGSSYTVAVNTLPTTSIAEIQAIEDYHENRLKKGLTHSTAVALNIILNEQAAQLNGQAALASNSQRHNAKLDLMYFKKRIKWLGVGSYNNSGFRGDAFEPATFQREMREQIARFAFQPTLQGQVGRGVADVRSYDNRRSFTQQSLH